MNHDLEKGGIAIALAFASQPAVSGIAVERCLYVSSSIRSINYIIHHGEAVLLQNRMGITSTTHWTNTNCGEGSVANLY